MRFMMRFKWLAPLLLCSVLAHADALPPLQSIASLDIQKYVGRWYEIAKFPNRFQKQCVSDTFADYALVANGHVRVLNQCRNNQGDWEQAVGLAKAKNPDDTARLQVRFAPAWLSFLPWVWGDYWVIDLDDDYQLVAVSEPKKEYLWILSRTQKVDPARYQSLLTRLQQKGFDLRRLEITQQDIKASRAEDAK